ncbi:MAG: hypothetical protein IH628_13200, partial [Proteobacteria bacterium]|nr:hypothetical protein [Pseudomonadota bacterium]
ANSYEILLHDKNKPARQVVAAEKPAAPTVVASEPTAAAKAAAGPVGAAAKPEQPAARVAEGKGAPAGEYRIINTPFGPTKRRIQ